MGLDPGCPIHIFHTEYKDQNENEDDLLRDSPYSRGFQIFI